MKENDDKTDEERRRLEISRFSAFAAGGSGYAGETSSRGKSSSPVQSFTGSSRASIDTPSNTASETPLKATEMRIPVSTPPGNIQVDSENFSRFARSDVASGTFTTSISSNNYSSDYSNSNLQAAAASLDGSSEKPTVEPAALPPMVRLDQAKKAKAINMHCERVVLHRPLFFGPVLPPRVLIESRQIVKDAMEKSTSTSEDGNKGQLPQHVRNLIDSIETFGYGLSPYPEADKDDIKEGEPSFYTGNACVSTYQPVWGDEVRTERETSFYKKRSIQNSRKKKETISSSITTSKKLQDAISPVTAVSSISRSSDTDTEINVFAAMARGYTTSSVTTANSVSRSSDTDTEINTFAALARGDTASPVTAANTISRSSDKDAEINMFAAMARGDTTSPVTTANSISRSSDAGAEINMFAALARGDAKSPATTANPISRSSDTDAEINMFAALARGDSHSRNTILERETETSAPSTSQLPNEKNFIPQFAKGEIPTKIETPTASTSQSQMNDKNIFSQFARGEIQSNSINIIAEKETKTLVPSTSQSPMSDKDIFSQLARGELPSGGNLNSGGSFIGPNKTSRNKQASDTFRSVQPITDDSDDDSVVGSEMKKKVGQNENLETALNYLQNDQTMPSRVVDLPESISVEESQNLLSQLGQTTSGGRPITNLELTSGCVPHFSCDDPSLPCEADLAIYETKEDQVRALEKQRSKEIVEKHTMPDVFGPISCPNPSMGPDDNHSSNLRTVPSRKAPIATTIVTGPGLPLATNTPTRKGLASSHVPSVKAENENTNEPIIQLPPSLHKTITSPQMKKDGSVTKSARRAMKPPPNSSRYGTATRYGWWNVEAADSQSEKQKKSSKPSDGDGGYGISTEFPLAKPRIDQHVDGFLVNTGLKPSPAKLREENLPLSHLHPATSIASTLPFLSDRPPSWRYLQIDTKAIGFPPLGGEIEPLFCSLAIYHVETVATTGSEHGVPAPNLQKCGRVTEILHFDVVTDESVERRCFGALWPYHHSVSTDSVDATKRTQGTKCGIFPIPSNLNIANLYAILVIQKVLTRKSDANCYAARSENDAKVPFEKEKYREKAEKASFRQGQFLMPFAFGVTPLLQVFGTDVPTIPTSRAVQIPLFQFTASPGEEQIIDHIMVMLYPRADHQSVGISGPAPLTNGGTAMLVMRYFGYLGLHSVVHNKSSLARHRLVDFTGELQIRRKQENEKTPETRVKDQSRSDRDYVVEPIGSNFISEPTKFCGRNVVPMLWPRNNCDNSDSENDEKVSKDGTNPTQGQELSISTLYAQELAALPLQDNPSTVRLPASPIRMNHARPGMNNSTCEPYFHTSFCNELLCNPRLVHNCPKGNIVTKVELREVEWNEELNSHIARLPKNGPYLHNQRRGPSFVHEAYSSCIPSSSSANFRVNFLNEFKIKLPLLLSDPSNPDKQLVLLFCVYHVEVKHKKTWTELGAKAISKKFGMPLHSSESKKWKAPIELLGCGFLPITTNSETSCLIDNGLHDVRLCYDAKSVADEVGNELLLTPKVTERRETSVASGFEDESTCSLAERTTVGGDDAEDGADPEGGNGSVQSKAETASSLPFSDVTSITDQPTKISNSTMDQISLQVRIIVHSSIHPQNATLNDFLQHQPRAPIPLRVPTLSSESPWRFDRENILKFVQANNSNGSTQLKNDKSQKALRAAIDICKPSLCSYSSLSRHFLRITKQLLTIMVSGSGEPSLLWANPALVLPLRINAFASFMQLINFVSSHLSKFGLTQLDGKSKWNITTFGNVVALFFDEENMFLDEDSAIEPLDLQAWESKSTERKIERPKLVKRKSSGSRRRHVRTDSGNLIFSAETVEGRSPSQSASRSQNMSNMDADIGPSSSSTGVSNNRPPTGRTLETLTSAENLSEDESYGNLRNETEPKPSFLDTLFSLNSTLDNDPFGGSGVSGGGRRKFMTLPTNALATIREDNDSELSTSSRISNSPFKQEPNISESSDSILAPFKASSTLDPDIVRKTPGSSVKKFRVPKVKGPSAPGNTELNVKEGNAAEDGSDQRVLLMDDDAIETAGAEFLDAVGKSLGFSPRTSSGEEQRVGHSHHRKTRSKCSIDWTLPDDDLLLERGQSLELQSSILSSANNDVKCADTGGAIEDEMSSSLALDVSSLKLELDNTQKLPSYLDRILLLKKYNTNNGRWFPYVYEVIIFQWVAILKEQHRNGEKGAGNQKNSEAADDYSCSGSDGETTLRNAALRARGFAVSCAPVMLEIMKKSLGYRLHALLRQADQFCSKSTSSPILIRLDAVVLTNLESLISMVTDACIDSRNFDSREFQQTSIEVNDSIVRFLRDLFSFLDPESVHRLILVYFSRFVVKDGKQWQDRDSKIGLKCSWEICKMRLNAITAFVRFPDFVRVNSPQMANWNTTWAVTSEADIAKSFFDQSLEVYLSLGLPKFVTPDGPNTNASLAVPRLKPHWLAELVVDICLAGTDHAEQKIQYRASSLLHELFWSQSNESKVAGTSTMVASVYISFLRKVLSHISYLSCLGAKTQLRKDLMPCVIFVFQRAPTGLLRSLWRKLCLAAQGEGSNEKYGPIPRAKSAPSTSSNYESNKDPNILDMFSLLNIALATFEYEGCEDNLDCEEMKADNDLLAVWEREYLVAIKEPSDDVSVLRVPMSRRLKNKKNQKQEPTYSSTNLRKWHSHDGSLVVINSCRYIVRELLSMLEPGKQVDNSAATINSSFKAANSPLAVGSEKEENKKSELNFSDADKILFIRAATSVYLHSLSLRVSDIVVTKTLTASIELVKIFGIRYFLDAIGETLQHWMRVVTMHCGARRADVRVQALEFLALILRMTWDTFGSFSRVRLPLLAIQTEVMERIVATAATRYYGEQRKISASMQYLSNDSAEASLSMLWRTLDRLHNQSASTNYAYKSALERLAQRMKTLYKAYIAAHALSILKRARSTLSPVHANVSSASEENDLKLAAINQRRRISVHRIVSASAGYCKQFIGACRPTPQRETVAHNEAVEDAFLEAADVFSATELPSHRVAWLQKLAEFHATRFKYAEEATCHYQIQLTFRQASRLHEMIWSSAPFLPWTEGGVHIDGEGPAGEPDEYYDTDEFDNLVEEEAVSFTHYERQVEKTNAFRRIFYRVANSVRMRTGDWEISGNKHVFYGVSHVSEYGNISSWIPIREMEERMIESSELAGELYLKAGIAESSRVAWGLATTYYAVRYNYIKLAHAYRRLSMVVSSEVPVVDTNEHALDFSHPIGRFYRVYFHGGAPDELIGAEFVYRAPSSVKLQEFGQKLSEVIRCILPENTPIDLVLDDGRPEEPSNWRSNQRRAVGPTSLEPVKIKVTPLRALLRRANEIGGTPEWFQTYTEAPRPESTPLSQESSHGYFKKKSDGMQQHRSHHSQGNHERSFSASMFASGGSLSSRLTDGSSRPSRISTHEIGHPSPSDGLVGVDKFSFLQPIRRDRQSRDWLKASGDFTEKTLRVTQLQVERTFPACVARQSVVNRTVFKQSPLEAGLDALCTWCSVLFRTSVATNGMRVIGKYSEHGIGSAAAKVVADCIHSSRVKEMGIILLKNHRYVVEEGEGEYGAADSKRISEDEVRRLQVKLARCLVVFIELLHLLISRNRDLLLAVVEARKTANNIGTASSSRPGSSARDNSVGSPGGLRKPRYSSIATAAHTRTSSNPTHIRNPSSASYISNSNNSMEPPKRVYHSREGSRSIETPGRARPSGGASIGTASHANDKTDSAIAVQSELQRAFISMSKALYPNILRILESETPRWLRQCSQDNYFSSYTYRQTSIPMADEVCFFSGQDFVSVSDNETTGSFQMTSSFVSSAHPGLTGLMQNTDSFSVGSFTESSIVSRGSLQRPVHHKKVPSSDSANVLLASGN
mmetsp:Transcript_5966/g.9423  ORF Transcript_5966/g.9423 Transcript_5966/m.9423 type:complete len:3872 (+) Transcript_5966:128-11743(+)